MKTFGVTVHTNLAPLKCCRRMEGKNVQVQHPSKLKKMKHLHKIEGALLQCVNNHYAKFDCKGMNTVEVTDYTN